MDGSREGVRESGASGAGAGSFDGAVLKGFDGWGDFGGCCAVDGDGEGVAAVGDFGGGEGGGVGSGDGEGNLGDEFEFASGYEVGHGSEGVG